METQTLSSCFSLSASIIIFLLIITFQQICCDAKHHPPCPSSSCANFTNITSPFRLKSYPNHCGHKNLELDCVENGSVLTYSSGKYHVNNINYTKYTISLSDAGVVEDATCSYIPRYFNYSYADGTFYSYSFLSNYEKYSTIAYLNCTNPVMDDHRYVKVNISYSCGFGRHVYAVWMQQMMKIADIRVGCRMIVVTVASKTLSDVELNRGVSYSEIHKRLVDGFEVSWSRVICGQLCGIWNECEVLIESTREKCLKQYCQRGYIPNANCGIFYRIIDSIGDGFHMNRRLEELWRPQPIYRGFLFHSKMRQAEERFSYNVLFLPLFFSRCISGQLLSFSFRGTKNRHKQRNCRKLRISKSNNSSPNCGK